ncbi:MAG: citramalate synthase [Candidatus Staskawiczbacteria bacterium]|nr:citramalate synthase [Candidatus Staskawiczbacteria bacterium]
MSKIVKIYDTTLRDGTQGENVSFSGADKIRIADRLDAFGVHYIEGGWPGACPKDMEFFVEARKRSWRHAKIVAFGSTRRAKEVCSHDSNIQALVEAHTPVVTMVGKTWSLHVREVIRTTLEENLAMIADSVRYFKERDKEVFYDAEHFFDGYKDDPDYALKTLRAAQDAGADVLVLCDTNGGTMPHEISRIVGEVKRQFHTALGIHTHNDCGLAVANALAAVEQGVTQVQGTINGYGERAGNCNLITVIANLVLKMGVICIPQENLRYLRELSQFVDDLANVRPDIRQPFVGATAFAHKGGIHVNAIEKVARSYEHIDPELVGNRRRVLVSELSGRSNVLLKAQELGLVLDKNAPELHEVLKQLKEMEHRGYEFEAADASFRLLVEKAFKRYEPFFQLLGYRVIMDRFAQDDQQICEASVKLRVGDKVEHTVAEGDGPVNALDKALRAALVKFYPAIQNVRLVDYKVRILDSGAGTAAKTRVIIESTDGNSVWGTVGVHDNIIEASWEALMDSYIYAIWMAKK